jgi:hypothetical protein
MQCWTGPDDKGDFFKLKCGLLKRLRGQAMTNSRRSQRILGVILGAILFCVASAHAQFSSAIEGTVKDSSGAAIVGAQVTLANIETNVTQEAKSDQSGYFRFASLAPGVYTVTANASGFQTVVQKNVELTAGRVQGVPLTVQVATASTSVSITAAPPLVQTDEPSISGLIDRSQMDQLPMQGRNFANVVTQTPGIVGTGAVGNSGLDIFANDQFPALLANGQPMSGNTVYIDGTYLSDSASVGSVKLVPNPDSIQEVAVSTNDYTAQFGMGGGAIVQIVSRSGTNKFHGSLFEFHQDNWLTARTEFQNSVNPATGRILPVSRRNEFGGSLGGPIFKDKTFFFLTYDQLRSTTANAYLATAETPQFVSFMEDNYPNNISTSLLKNYHAAIGPLSGIQTVSSLSPGCSGVGPLGMPCDLPLLGTGSHSFVTPRNGLQWNLRIDHNFSAGDKIYGNFYRTTEDSLNDQVRPAWQNDGPNSAYFGGLTWIHVFSPSLLLESAYGGTHQTYHTSCPNCQIPDINVSGMSGFGANGSLFPSGFANADAHWREMLSFTKGKHALRVGFEMFHDQNFAKFTDRDARPLYTFLDVFDFASDTPQFQSLNYDPRNGGPANGDRYWLRSQYGAYVQDDWKIKPNLSINLGLRWDVPSNPSEAKGNATQLVLGSGSSLQEQVAGISVIGARNLFTEERLAYLAPRIGIAWQPAGVTNVSVRAGFGLFYNRGGDTLWSDTGFNNPPVAAALTANVLVPNGPQPVYGLCRSGTFPYDCPTPPLPAGLNERGGSVAGPSDIGGADVTLRQAYAENWFLGLQRSFGQNWVIEADYMGSNGIHLYSEINRNRYAGDRVIHNGDVTRLNPFFGAITYADNSNQSAYNGGDIALQRRLSHGVSFQTGFTFGKAIDLMGGAPGCNRCSETDGVVDAYDLRAQRGLSEGDVNKQFTFNALWQIPTPQSWGAVPRGILGGWRASALGVLSAGTPQSVFSGTADYNGDGNFYDYPNLPSFGKNKTGLSRSDYLNGVFVASDFPSPCPTAAPCGINGDLGRDPYRGPGFAQTDMAFAKNNHIPWFLAEGASVEFRAELFNAFNRVNLAGWDTNLSDGLFGKATGTSQARTTQLSLHITF